MKNTSYLIPGILIFIISIPVIFYLWFAAGMISSSSAKTIKTDWVKQYKYAMKTDYINISDIKVYYQFGRVHFDFTVNPKMSVDEYNEIVKKTKDLVVEDTISKLLRDQMTLIVKFDSMKDIYLYESPYWVHNQDITDTVNRTIENNYKEWYLHINDKLEKIMEF
jgi:serine protease inhibitor